MFERWELLQRRVRLIKELDRLGNKRDLTEYHEKMKELNALDKELDRLNK